MIFICISPSPSPSSLPILLFVFSSSSFASSSFPSPSFSRRPSSPDGDDENDCIKPLPAAEGQVGKVNAGHIRNDDETGPEPVDVDDDDDDDEEEVEEEEEEEGGGSTACSGAQVKVGDEKSGNMV